MAVVETSLAHCANQVIERYASNEAFRSATVDELVNYADPLRRPVRTQDLPALDYAGSLERPATLNLSSLLGHRMLINLYERCYAFLPAETEGPAWTTFEQFYATGTAPLRAQARDALERYLFAWLRTCGPDDIDLTDLLRSTIEARLAAERDLASLLSGLANRRRGVTFLLLQRTCDWPAAPSALHSVLASPGIRSDPTLTSLVNLRLSSAARRCDLLDRWLNRADLSTSPRAYWQFYLTSSLAKTNNTYRLATEPALIFECVGSLCHEIACDWCQRLVIEPAIDAHLGLTPEEAGPTPSATDLCDQVVKHFIEPLIEQYGYDRIHRALRRGIEDASRVAQMADEDLSAQLRWADRIDHCKAEATRLQAAIDSGDLISDLDTFVESGEETSTTHVHDDTRLVTVESGSMQFWANAGERIALAAGESMLIPRARLHGSVVTSSSCRYHHPLIHDEWLTEAL